MGHVRILLSEAASKHLLEAGERFMVAGKSSHPEIPVRVVLHLQAIPMDRASAASEVATGARKAGKLIVTPEITPGRVHVDPGESGRAFTNHSTTANSTNP